MWQRFTFYDVRVIAHYLGVLTIYAALAMAIPLFLAFFTGEWQAASRYLLAFGITATAGALLRMLRIEPGHLNKRQAIAVCGFAWIVLAIFAAIPLALSGHYASYFDALFDSVAALTTTDTSTMLDCDHLAYADNMWRFIMNAAGGLSLVIVAISLGFVGRISDSNLYAIGGGAEHVLPGVMHTAHFVYKFAGAVVGCSTVVLGICLTVMGMHPARAFLHGLWLSISGFMTAGLAPMSTAITYYHSIVLELLLMLLMLLGCISFVLQNQAWRGRTRTFLKDSEVRTGVVWLGLMGIIFASSMNGSALASHLTTQLRTGLFNFIAAATTTGFVPMYSNQLIVLLPSGTLLVMALLMAIGGCAGSTSGGIKLRRVGVIAKSAMETMKATVSPDSSRIVTSYYHVGRRRLESSEVKEAMTVFILFMAVYTIGALAGIACGYDGVSAITESVAMTSNSGITSSIPISDMPGLLKGLYIVQMWTGRMEFVTLVALMIKIIASLKPKRLDKGMAS